MGLCSLVLFKEVGLDKNYLQLDFCFITNLPMSYYILKTYVSIWTIVLFFCICTKLFRQTTSFFAIKTFQYFSRIAGSLGS